MARTARVGITLNLARTYRMGIMLYLARTPPLDFTTHVARTRLMGITLRLARTFSMDVTRNVTRTFYLDVIAPVARICGLDVTRGEAHPLPPQKVRALTDSAVTENCRGIRHVRRSVKRPMGETQWNEKTCIVYLDIHIIQHSRLLVKRLP